VNAFKPLRRSQLIESKTNERTEQKLKRYKNSAARRHKTKKALPADSAKQLMIEDH